MPDWKPEIRLRLQGLQLAPTREAAIIEELAQYLEDCYVEWLASGATEAEAYQQTLAELSGSEILAHELRRVERQSNPELIVLGINRRTNMIADLWQDLRFGVRMLMKQPGFTLIAVMTLALGIGANTAIFSVVNAVLLRHLPYREPERIVKLWNTFPAKGVKQLPFSGPEFLEYRNQSQSFGRVGAYFTFTRTLTGAGEPERIPATWASADLFSVLGVQPLLGRAFSAAEDMPGQNGVVLLSYRLWQRRFGADPNIVGKPIALQGWSYTVVGVMPRGFQFPSEDVEMWMPLAIDPASPEVGTHHLSLIAHIRPEATLEQARVELQMISGRIARKYPEYYKGVEFTVTATRLHEETVGDVRPALLVLLGAVGFMLLIACANVANLLLARATARTKEIATRMALGASRLRIVRQLLTESLLLFVVGGTLGLLLAMWGVKVLVANSPVDLPRAAEVTIDGWALMFTALASVLTGVFFGLAPALQTSKTDLNETLKEGGRSATEGKSRSRLRNLLVVAEVALSVVLLTGAGLMIRSFARLLEVRLGFDPENVLTMGLDLPSSKYPEGQQITAFYRELVERVKGLPGVQGAAVASQPFPSEKRNDSSFEAEGRTLESGRDVADFNMISPDYFRTMKIPLLRGRYFSDADSERLPSATIVNQTMAQLVWPGEDPIGKRIRMTADSPWLSVVGVVADVKNRGLRSETKPDMFFPYTEKPFGQGRWIGAMTLVVRTASDPQAIINAIKGAIRALDSDLPVYKAQTMTQFLAASNSQMRFTTALLSCFACLALILAAVGVYGVMASSVARRTHEIGLRMALGAQPSEVLRLALWQGMKLALIGTLMGLGGALALTRLMEGLLFGVSATDPLTFTAIALLLIMVALLACFVPARRATRVDPMVALRYE